MDWYEAWADLGGERTRVQVFAMRSMASGAAFHRAYLHATQQAFLEAHEAAFAYFGGVFRLLRYDNLASAVRKILRGHRREETARFVAFRSHWRFAAEFCTPGEGHEKGGVEGEVGYFRRNHLVPVPARGRPRRAERAAAGGLPRGRGADPGRAQRGGRRGDGGGARPPAAARGRGVRPGRGDVPAGGQAGLRHGQDQRLLGARPGGQPGGGAGRIRCMSSSGTAGGGWPATSAATAAASRCWTSSTTSTCWATSPAPWPGPGRWSSGARPGAGPPATTRSGTGCGPGTASRTAPAPWWRCCCWAGSSARSGCGRRSPRRCRSAPATSRRCATC